jgi:hypothetical protein
MIKKNQVFYLAHSVELISSVRRWELKIQGNYYIDLKNPFKNPSESIFMLKKLKTRKAILEYMKGLTPEVCVSIVKEDLELLRKCDGVVAIFNEPSIGTSMEIFAAVYLYQIPVFVICKEYSNHPWIIECCRVSGGKTFKTRKDFEKELREEKLQKEI